MVNYYNNIIINILLLAHNFTVIYASLNFAIFLSSNSIKRKVDLTPKKYFLLILFREKIPESAKIIPKRVFNRHLSIVALSALKNVSGIFSLNFSIASSRFFTFKEFSSLNNLFNNSSSRVAKDRSN